MNKEFSNGTKIVLREEQLCNGAKYVHSEHKLCKRKKKCSFESKCATLHSSEGVTKPPWSSEQIEVNLNFLEVFGYILSRNVFLNNFKARITPFNQLQK